jgi:hypothetical protein
MLNASFIFLLSQYVLAQTLDHELVFAVLYVQHKLQVSGEQEIC